VTAQPDIYADLKAEGAELDQLVASLDESQWELPTPAPGWTVAHQIAHLASIFSLAALAAAQPDSFQALTAQLSDDFEENVAAALQPYLASPTAELLAKWREERAKVEAAVAAVPPDQMVPWLVRPLPCAVLAAAGMTELFAHGQDIADAVGVPLERTDRIRHIAEFATRTWDFGYLARGLNPPAQTFRFVLAAPSGAWWEFGPTEATQQVTGPAVDFCLLATRRRHRDDLALTASGPDADHWLNIAQAYRGSPGEGRSPGQFAVARV
jgi:uncharacterized protein (TIGR03084 family)